jgi:hypothetical protein
MIRSSCLFSPGNRQQSVPDYGTSKSQIMGHALVSLRRKGRLLPAEATGRSNVPPVCSQTRTEQLDVAPAREFGAIHHSGKTSRYRPETENHRRGNLPNEGVILGQALSRGTLAKIEAQVRCINDQTLLVLAKALELTVNNLYS